MLQIIPTLASLNHLGYNLFMTEEEITYPDIAEQIKKMQDKEQTFIRATIDDSLMSNSENQQIYQKMITEHTQKMKEIIQKIGWPTISKVGKEASHNAWNLIQHADDDVEFQAECLNLIKQQEEGEVLKKEIAYLTDRIACNKGELQVYGTQLSSNDKEEFVRLKNVIDPDNLDKRRNEMALEPMNEYIIETANFYKRGYNLKD